MHPLQIHPSVSIAIETLLEEAKTSKAAMETRLKEMEDKLEAKNLQISKLMAPVAAISAEQLADLQARVERLHKADLLADEVIILTSI